MTSYCRSLEVQRKQTLVSWKTKPLRQVLTILLIDYDLEVDKQVGEDNYYLQRDIVEYVERDRHFSWVHVEEVDVVDSEDPKIHGYVHREACVRRDHTNKKDQISTSHPNVHDKIWNKRVDSVDTFLYSPHHHHPHHHWAASSLAIIFPLSQGTMGTTYLALPQIRVDTPQHHRSKRMPAMARYTCFKGKVIWVMH